VEYVATREAPQPVGPYSQAVIHEGLVWVAGQVALDPETGRPRGETIEEQAELALANVGAILRAAGSDVDKLVRVTVYMADLSEFARFNAVYERFLGDARPARSTVQAGALPLGLKVEVDAVAAR
jgi:2-iminobutanoate/2-iminopropanoate deaminase